MSASHGIQMRSGCLWLSLMILTSAGLPLSASEEDHAEEEKSISLNESQLSKAKIETMSVTLRDLRANVVLPGEVKVNGYRTSQVTPRIPSVVEKRHVELGDIVDAGQTLVTLSSIDVAEAAGELMLAAFEWRLVQELSSEATSGRRKIEAEAAYRKAMSRVRSFGLTNEQANDIAKSNEHEALSGTFNLLAPQSGTVFNDDFVIGSLVEPGHVLIEIVDESSVWVEASAIELPEVETGSIATVILEGGERVEGHIVQLFHHLDTSTRTRSVRIEVNNEDDTLHPGQFVQVEISTGISRPVLAVPSSAVTLINGQKNVFLSEEGEFHATLVADGLTYGDWVAIESGLDEGDRIVTNGVFYLKSLLLKSSLGSGHAH